MGDPQVRGSLDGGPVAQCFKRVCYLRLTSIEVEAGVLCWQHQPVCIGLLCPYQRNNRTVGSNVLLMKPIC